MRREFSRKTKAFVALRAGGKCEKCQANLKVGAGEYDHVLAAALGGDNSPDNCQLICTPCHRGPDGKTVQDVRRIRKSDRQRDKHSGAFKKRTALSSPKVPKPPLTKSLPPKPLYMEKQP